MASSPRPVVLVILDGWGYREAPEHNAILAANTPTWDRIWAEHPHSLLNASEAAVGLPARQMGNSEVGHLNLGAGRVVYQEFSRVNQAIVSGEFFANHVLTDAVDLARDTGKAIHIMGLLSDGGVHSHEDQIKAMAELAAQRGATKIFLHAFLDGRDTPPKSAQASIEAMEAKFQELGRGRFASIIGRYYAMDRDHRWPRVQAAYDLISQGQADYQATSAGVALEMAYARDETDEFVKATAIVPPGETPVRMADGDVLIMMNFRSDRARQITRAFIEDHFGGFERAVRPRLGQFVSLTEYRADFDTPVAFPPGRLDNVLGAYLASLGKHQLRIAETEKYAHVTFFFNGGIEKPFEGEDRLLIPSPTDIATYNLKPQMSAPEVTDKLVAAIESEKYDTIICNFANTDMVGHTGDMDATVKAVETIDDCLAKITAALAQAGGELLITADHGNAEQLFNPDTAQAHTAHTTNPVPFVYLGRPATIAASGALEDVAPTLLYLMDLPIPREMTGHSLVQLDERAATGPDGAQPQQEAV